jgi:hypothetical protein
VDPGPILIILQSPVYFSRTVYFSRILYCFPLDTLIIFVSSKPVRLTTSSQIGNKVLGCVCADSISPSVVAVSPLLIDKPWFLNWGKTSRYTHHTFLLGFPTGWSFTTHKDSLLPHQLGRSNDLPWIQEATRTFNLLVTHKHTLLYLCALVRV